MEKEKTIKEDIDIGKINKEELNLQRFFDDMQLIGDQTRSDDTTKPNFHYGDLSVTNYLLWLMLAELMMLNEKAGDN